MRNPKKAHANKDLSWWFVISEGDAFQTYLLLGEYLGGEVRSLYPPREYLSGAGRSWYPMIEYLGGVVRSWCLSKKVMRRNEP